MSDTQTGTPEGQQPQAPAQTSNPQAPAQASPQNQTPTAPTQRPAAAQNPGQGGDQNRGLLQDLQRERKARQTLENQIQQANAQLEAERNRIKALVGVTPQSEEDQQIEAAKQRLVQMFPVLQKLDEETLNQLLEVRAGANQMRQMSDMQYQRQAREAVDTLAAKVSDVVGFEINERQWKSLGRAFLAEIESNPEFERRFLAGDQRVIDEFAKQWAEDWHEPVRRSTLNAEVQRRPRVPNGRDRNVQTTPPKPVNFKDNKATEDAMVEAFKRHGGSFGS